MKTSCPHMNMPYHHFTPSDDGKSRCGCGAVQTYKPTPPPTDAERRDGVERDLLFAVERYERVFGVTLDYARAEMA